MLRESFKSKIIVTGGLGFIGSHVCESLLKSGHKVLAVDNWDPSYSSEVKGRNFQILSKFENFEVCEQDILNSEKITQIFKKWQPDLVVHAAAKAGVRPSLEFPLEYADKNIKATLSLLESMIKVGCRKLVFFSSSSVYGERVDLCFDESVDFLKAKSFYATSKQCCELIIRQYYNLHGLSSINLRFFSIYGPRQRPDLIIYKLLDAVLRDNSINIYGDGSVSRDFTYVEDAVSGIIASINLLINCEESLYETINIGSSRPVSLNKLIGVIEKISDRKINIELGDSLPCDAPLTCADITRAKLKLNYLPKWNLEDGLRIQYEWQKQEFLTKNNHKTRTFTFL